MELRIYLSEYLGKLFLVFWVEYGMNMVEWLNMATVGSGRTLAGTAADKKVLNSNLK